METKLERIAEVAKSFKGVKQRGDVWKRREGKFGIV